MENIPKKIITIQNHYVFLVIFQIYKNAVFKNVHSYGGSFDYDFTPLLEKKCFFDKRTSKKNNNLKCKVNTLVH
jgi:hypothetical protein